LGAQLIDRKLQHKIPQAQYDLPVHQWLKQYCETAKQYAQEVDDEGFRFYEAGAEASNALDSDEIYRAWSDNHVREFIAKENLRQNSDKNVRDASSLVSIETLSHKIASTQCLRNQTCWLASTPTMSERLPVAFQVLWNGRTQKMFYELMHMIELIRLRGMYCYVKEYKTNQENTWRLGRVSGCRQAWRAAAVLVATLS